MEARGEGNMITEQRTCLYCYKLLSAGKGVSVGGNNFCSTECVRALSGGYTSVQAGEAIKSHPTGAVRSETTGKGRYDLIPEYPIKRLAIHYENGAAKYEDRNWEKGLPLSRFLDSAQRHMGAFKDGDRTEDHLGAVMWNVAGYLWTEREVMEGRLPETLNDVPWPSSLPGVK
jgi:Domain of unknown function (DUF5664)